MLPDLRAVVAAIVAAIGLMMGAFGLAATVRVAHDNQSSPLDAVRSTLLTDAAIHREFLKPPSMARDERAPTLDTPAPDTPATDMPVVDVPAIDTVSIATLVAEDPTPGPAPPQPPPQQVAPPPPAPTGAFPLTSIDIPETTGSIEAAHADASVPATLAPSAALPVGGPLQEAAITPMQAPDLKPVLVKKKPRAAVKRQRGSRQARAREAARRIAAAQARRARTEQAPWGTNTLGTNSWSTNAPANARNPASTNFGQ